MNYRTSSEFIRAAMTARAQRRRMRHRVAQLENVRGAGLTFRGRVR